MTDSLDGEYLEFSEYDDADDVSEGTDADFSGDVAASLQVPGAHAPAPAFTDLEQNALDDPELRSFLSGGHRALIVHKSFNYASSLTKVVGEARKSVGGACSVGLSVPFFQSTEAMRQFIAQFPNTSIRFADPDLHRHDSCYGDKRPTGKKHHSHFNSPIPPPSDAAWAENLLRAQIECGATVLLSPTGKVEEANAAASLAQAMERVATARAVAGGAPMFVNLTFDHRWLTQKALRVHLLNEVVDSAERHWHLRFRWPIVDPRYGQLTDPTILEGYAELAAVCSDEHKILVLPNSDLTGWIATALGAAGFGTGTSRAERKFGDERVMGSKKGAPRPDPKKRYFSRPILHTIEQATHEQLVGSKGYTLCTCPYCGGLKPERNAPTTWDLEAVGNHYVHHVAGLTALLATDPRDTARRTVRQALKVVADIPVARQPTGDDRPNHLDRWLSLLT